MRSLPAIYRAYAATLDPPVPEAKDDRLCTCNAFSFPHLRFAGDCEGAYNLGSTTTEAPCQAKAPVTN